MRRTEKKQLLQTQSENVNGISSSGEEEEKLSERDEGVQRELLFISYTRSSKVKLS